MYTGIFDTHAHYDDEAFDSERDELISEMLTHSVSGIINCGCTVNSSLTSQALAEKFGGVYFAAGIHPQNAAEENGDWLKKIEEIAVHEKCVAIGEIGLDYHYDYTPKEMQKQFFEQQLQLANRLDLPVIVHDREAHADCLDLILKYKPKGVMHCFSGSVESAEQLVEIGFYIGIGGSVTFKNAKKPAEVAAAIPLERLLLETDAPYMTPVPHRGKRNNSFLISHTAERIAELRSTDAQSVINAARENACRLFTKIR